MWIGVGRIVLDFYNNESSSLKRRNLEKLCQDLRKKYNLSILEVADFEDPERCVIGFAAVMAETVKSRQVRDFLDQICKTIDTTSFARVTSEDLDILSHGE